MPEEGTYTVLYNPTNGTTPYNGGSWPTGIPGWFYNSGPGHRKARFQEALRSVRACKNLGWRAFILRTS